VDESMIFGYFGAFWISNVAKLRSQLSFLGVKTVFKDDGAIFFFFFFPNHPSIFSHKKTPICSTQPFLL
jgi:hypothetical protein